MRSIAIYQVVSLMASLALVTFPITPTEALPVRGALGNLGARARAAKRAHQQHHLATNDGTGGGTVQDGHGDLAGGLLSAFFAPNDKREILNNAAPVVQVKQEKRVKKAEQTAVQQQQQHQNKKKAAATRQLAQKRESISARSIPQRADSESPKKPTPTFTASPIRPTVVNPKTLLRTSAAESSAYATAVGASLVYAAEENLDDLPAHNAVASSSTAIPSSPSIDQAEVYSSYLSAMVAPSSAQQQAQPEMKNDAAAHILAAVGQEPAVTYQDLVSSSSSSAAAQRTPSDSDHHEEIYESYVADLGAPTTGLWATYTPSPASPLRRN